METWILSASAKLGGIELLDHLNKGKWISALCQVRNNDGNEKIGNFNWFNLNYIKFAFHMSKLKLRRKWRNQIRKNRCCLGSDIHTPSRWWFPLLKGYYLWLENGLGNITCCLGCTVFNDIFMYVDLCVANWLFSCPGEDGSPVKLLSSSRDADLISVSYKKVRLVN